MRASRWLFVPGFLALAGSCSNQNQHTYAQAGVAAVVAVTTVGIHRALTSDCWARCRPGYLCNRESGLCELGECLPGCPYGTHCVRDVGGKYRCASDLGNQPIQSSFRTPPASDAGLASDASPASDGAIADADAEATSTAADASLPEP
jgi:hypothetical protein